MIGIIGKKIGMTSIFQEDGRNIQVTVIEAGPCAITQIKTEDTDGYNSYQLAFGGRTEKHTTKAMAGHFKKSGTSPKRKLIEFRNFDVEQLQNPVPAEGEEVVEVGEKGLGAEIFLTEVFAAGDYVDVTGRSKGKGFQGVVRRHGFHGVGMATHGQHNRGRAPGSIGMASTPSKVFKGMKMAGRMGHDRITTKNLEVIQIMPEKNMLLVKGAVPGPKGGYLIIKK